MSKVAVLRGVTGALFAAACFSACGGRLDPNSHGDSNADPTVDASTGGTGGASTGGASGVSSARTDSSAGHGGAPTGNGADDGSTDTGGSGQAPNRGADASSEENAGSPTGGDGKDGSSASADGSSTSADGPSTSSTDGAPMDRTGGISPDAGAVSDAGGPVSCPSTCSTPMGPLYEFSSVIDLNNALVGRWLICPGAGTALPNMPSDTVGIEFETTKVNSEWSLDGKLYYLVAGANGPVRGGPDHQFAYLVYRVDNDASITLHIDLGYPFYAIPPFRYSPCPMLFEIIGQQSDGAPGDRAILTPL